jgi:uncharacterized membrane protein YoaT (DUF817 family)
VTQTRDPDDHTRRIERRLGDWMRARLPSGLAKFVMFGLKQGWSCLFGGLLLVLLLLTKTLWQEDWLIYRYDFLVLAAIGIQALFLRFGLETWEEAKVILLFHITGTAMEFFKVDAGSWTYPEPGYLKLLGVPLFSGFMYASVGSYIARVIRVFGMRFAPFPPTWWVMVVAVLIYVNFFAHHVLPDIRIALFAATALLFLRTRIWFVVDTHAYWMPMPVAAVLAAFFLWVAENIGTGTGTWLYSGQIAGEMVRFDKLGSWYLLLWVAFATVTVVVRDCLRPDPMTAARVEAEFFGEEQR